MDRPTTRSKKIAYAGLLVAAWAASLAVTRALFAPATGAATVMQMTGSDGSYAASMLLQSASNWAVAGITVLFTAALFVLIRSKK